MPVPAPYMDPELRPMTAEEIGAPALHFTLPGGPFPSGSEVDFGTVPAGHLRAVYRQERVPGGSGGWRLTLQMDSLPVPNPSDPESLVQDVVNAACAYEVEPCDDHRQALFEAVRALLSSDSREFECPHCHRELLDPGSILNCPGCGRQGCYVEEVGGCIPGGPGIVCPGCGGPDETAFGELA